MMALVCIPVMLGFDAARLPPVALLIVGVVFISAWLLMRSRKRHMRGPGHTTARETLERYRQQDGLRNDLESLMVDIEQLAKRMGAQLDAKAIKIERLIGDADLRIAQLQKALYEQNNGEPPVAGSDASAVPEALGVSGTADLADGPADPLTAKIYGLADKGLAAPAIAQELDEHIGKVELILALRNA